MQMRKPLSILLALAILLGCMGWTPVRAEEATLDAASGTVTENIQSLEPEEGSNILQLETARGEEHVARLPNEEELNQHIFLNRDGSKTMYLYDHPVKYRDADGAMCDISFDIVETEDVHYPYRTKANSVVTSFPTDMADGVRLESEDVSVRLKAQMPATAEKNPLNRKVRRVDSGTVAYTYDENTVIEYSLTYAGFKEDIVVSEYTGQTEYHFTLYTSGLALTQIDGNYYLTDTSGGIRASIGQIIVLSADERNNAIGQLLITQVEEKQVYTMTIVLDAAYLADPNTKYPIRIDPTVNICYQYSGSTAVEDTTIHSEGISDHALSKLHVGLQQDTGIARILMKFPGLNFDALGTGVTITNATVYLYDVLQQQEVLDIYCHVYPIAWDAETFSGESEFAPAVGRYLCHEAISYDIGVTLKTPHYYGFNITAAVCGWMDGTYDQDKGIMFKTHAVVESGETYISKTFASYNSTINQPVLKLNYTAKQAGPAVPALTLSSNVEELNEGQTTTIGADAQVGVTVTWQSSDTNIASVSNGTIVAQKAGTAVITVTAVDGYGNTNVAYCTVYVKIPEGVYYIRNLSNPYYMTADKTMGLLVRQSTKVISYPDSLWQLWRVVYLRDGYYHIRPMGKLDYALKKKNTGAIAEYVGDTNTSSINEAKWLIEYDGGGYIFRNKSNTDQVLGPMGVNAENIALSVNEYIPTSVSQRWAFENVTHVANDALLYDIYDYEIVDNLVIWMGVGETKTLRELGIVATAISKDSISQDFVWGTDNNAVIVDRYTGTITAVAETLISAGVSGRVWYDDGSRVTVSLTVYVGPLPGGTYYIRNRYSHQYASAGASVDSNVTQSLFVPDGLTSWNVAHAGDGYYTICSTLLGSRYYLGVKAEDADDDRGEIVLCSDCGGDNARWRIELLPGGAYKLTPKSGDYALALNDSWLVNPDWSGIKLLQLEFTYDDNYEDEWLFCAVSDTIKLEAQETNVWCWAASSRMMASIFMNSQISQRSLAVYMNPVNPGIDVLIPEKDQITSATRPGTSSQEATAINYLLGRDKNLTSVTYATDQGRIYSSEVLRRFLDAGYPVLINRLTYSEEGVSGHASVICDYYYDSDEKKYMFTIYDPLTYDENTIDDKDFKTDPREYTRSYDWICDSRNSNRDDDEGILGEVWVSAVVFVYHEDYRTTIVNTSYQ